MAQIIETEKYIEIIGHYDNEIECAKMTLLANLFAIEHRGGYAKFKIEDKDKLGLVDKKLEFPIWGDWFKGLGLQTAVYLYNVTSGSFVHDGGDNIAEIGTLQTSEYLSIGRNLSRSSYIGLSSSNSSYVPITPTITNVTYGSYSDPTLYTAEFTETQFKTGEELQYQYWIITIEEPSSNNVTITYGNQVIFEGTITPPIAVTYNNSTITTLNGGDEKTLTCDGKVMASDIVVGNKTLKTNGKVMNGNISINVGGEVAGDYLLTSNDEILQTGTDENIEYTE